MLGRFISPDTIVSDPADPQTFNRYSYCNNNPVVYTDPSGHFLVIPVLLAGLFSGAVAEIQHPGHFWQGFLTGAISAIAFTWAGDIGAGGLGPIGNHAVAGSISGGINASITGGDVGMGMLTGGVSGGFGKFTGDLIPKGNYAEQLIGRSLVGGTTSGMVTAMYGGNFWDGFGSGALTAAAGVIYNDFMHDAVNAIAGFGDAASFNGSKMVRQAWGYDDVVDSDSAYYKGGEVTGIAALGTIVGTRALAYFGSTKIGYQILNKNRYIRIGSGRMPANGPFPAATHAPRISVGGTGGLHIDLRIRGIDKTH